MKRDSSLFVTVNNTSVVSTIKRSHSNYYGMLKKHGHKLWDYFAFFMSGDISRSPSMDRVLIGLHPSIFSVKFFNDFVPFKLLTY